MITFRRAEERRHERRRKQEAWLTFYPQDRADAFADGFAALEILDEHRLPPGASIPHLPPRDAEIVTYVRQGALANEDSIERHFMDTIVGGKQNRVVNVTIWLTTRQTTRIPVTCEPVYSTVTPANSVSRGRRMKMGL